jgi:GNAT superfamily N-acetyltransferase
MKSKSPWLYSARENTGMNRVDIIRASSTEDFDMARRILERQRRWLECVLEADLAAFQPSAVREFAEPELFYEPPDGVLLLAMVAGEAVGVVGVHRMSPGVGELKRMYTIPEARGLGVGQTLARAAVEASGDLGFEVLRLETHAGPMPVAAEMYRKLGFRETEPYHSVVGVDGLLTRELKLQSYRLSA